MGHSDGDGDGAGWAHNYGGGIHNSNIHGDGRGTEVFQEAELYQYLFEGVNDSYGDGAND